jgi:hypothetical protein
LVRREQTATVLGYHGTVVEQLVPPKGKMGFGAMLLENFLFLSMRPRLNVKNVAENRVWRLGLKYFS